MNSHGTHCRWTLGHCVGIASVLLFTVIAAAEPSQPEPPDQAEVPAQVLVRVGMGHEGQLSGLGLLDNGATLLTSAKDDTLRLWDLETGKPKGEIVAPRSRPKSIAVAPDGKLLAVLTPDRKIQLLESPGRLVREWQTEEFKNVGSVAFSPDGKCVVSSGKFTSLWDVATGKLLRQLYDEPEPMSSLAFSRDGKVLCTGSMRGMIRLWDVKTGQDLGELRGHTLYIDQVVFSPDGELLASVSHDGTARLWSLRSRLQIWSKNVGYGVSLAISRDGRSLAAGGQPGTVGVWEVASGLERAAFQSNSGSVMVLLFAADDKTLISGHQNSTALCWDFTGLGPERRHLNKALSVDDLEREWKHLGGSDARRAFQAIWVLAATGEQAVTRAIKELQPAKAVDDKLIAQCIIDLDNNKSVVSERAIEELKKVGDQAWPALRLVLANAPSLETKTRARNLLNLQFSPDPDRLRLIRTLELLEHIDNKEARTLLETLATGAPKAWLTQEATRILERMNLKN
jgi:dipeptidyl aminopeptidase/acylaminoacyl peptidase